MFMAERVPCIFLLGWLRVIMELVLSKGGGKLHFSFLVVKGDEEITVGWSTSGDALRGRPLFLVTVMKGSSFSSRGFGIAVFRG